MNRKRLWPKGHLADVKAERAKSVKEVTKILAKTKLLGLVPDDLRHLLGNDATRRGIFDVFDLFQHKALNHRLFYVLAENLLANFFETDTNLPLHPLALLNSHSKGTCHQRWVIA
jgi:sorting nexin-13